ncbi:MAG: TetR/AcrR family transcriptional regulator [Ilumatobacteraceae bacterium]
MVVRRNRAEVREANRRAVLDAAREQFEQHGYHGASLDVIADRAGFSKGAVYSRFQGKDDLFLAVLEENIERRHEASVTQASAAGGSGVAPLIEQAIRTSVGSTAWQAALLEFRAHAWRHPQVNERYAELHRRTIESITSLVEEVHRAAGGEPPMPARDLAVIALATATGLVTEHMSDPSLDTARLAIDMARAVEATALGDRSTR